MTGTCFKHWPLTGLTPTDLILPSLILAAWLLTGCAQVNEQINSVPTGGAAELSGPSVDGDPARTGVAAAADYRRQKKNDPFAVDGEVAGAAASVAQDLGRWLKEDPSLNRVAVTTFVDANDLTKTSALGRVMTEVIVSLLHRQGFEVIELRRTSNFLMAPKRGVFYMSREIKHLAAQHQVSSVVVGSYAEGLDSVVVTGRLISAVDGAILSSSVRELPKTANMIYLLGPDGPIKAQRAKRVGQVKRMAIIPSSKVPVYERSPRKK